VSSARKPFNDLGIVAAILGGLAWLAQSIAPSWGTGPYGEALLLLAMPCFLAQIVADHRQTR
jgi:hypothetical protein